MSADETVRLVLVEKYVVMTMPVLVTNAARSLMVATSTEAFTTSLSLSAAVRREGEGEVIVMGEGGGEGEKEV